MSELALASSHKARLAAMAEAGDKGATTALELLTNPTQFLSSVQVGITSIGMLNGIVGEAAFSDDLAVKLQSFGLAAGTAGITATAMVVAVITFVTIVFGELVPKRIGQLYPEAVARWVSRPLAWVARIARPFVALLSMTTHGTLKLLRIDTNAVQHVTEEEINASLEGGVDAGIIEEQERRMVHNVFLLDDRQLTSIMQPHADIDWIDANETVNGAIKQAWTDGHSWYPVCRGSLEDVIGVVHLPSLLALQAKGVNDAVREHAQPAVFVPETLTGMELLEQFRIRSTRIVFVVDEYGVVQGIVTPIDMLQAITGELSPELPRDAWAIPKENGSWLVDGAMPVAELKSRFEISELPEEDKGRYNTVAGLMQAVAGELLGLSQTVECAGWRFEVLALEGRRIDQILISPLPPEVESDGTAAAHTASPSDA